MNRLRTELEKVFGAEQKNYGCAQVLPKVNIWEDAESFLVEAEVPGINFEDIEILVLEGDQVSIKGERKQGQKEPSAWIRKERREGNFARNFKLSCSVNIDSVKATINTGVLEIHLPKAAGHHARKIEIETA